MMIKRIAVFFFLFCINNFSLAQTTPAKVSFFHRDTVYNPNRATIVSIGAGVAYVGSMAGLYTLWYSDYPSTSFHTFDDAGEWKQMDKIGHMGSAYYLSLWSNYVVTWTGTDVSDGNQSG